MKSFTITIARQVKARSGELVYVDDVTTKYSEASLASFVQTNAKRLVDGSFESFTVTVGDDISPENAPKKRGRKAKVVENTNPTV